MGRPTVTGPDGRREARAHLTVADQQRVAATAARYGMSGLGLTVWLLAQEVDGTPVDVALAMTNLVHLAVRSPGHRPEVRHDDRWGRFTVCHCTDDVWPGEPMVLPPVPGKPTATVFLPARPAAAGRSEIVELGPGEG